MLDKIKQLNPVKKNSAVKSNDQLLVGLDIGTEFVKVVIAKVDEGELEVVGVGRARQSLSDMQAGAVSDIAGVVANCEKALTQAEEMAGASPRQAVIGIAGELVKELLRQLSIVVQTRKNRLMLTRSS